MVLANLGLVAYLATRFRGRGLATDDLIGEGMIGLVRAASTFDPAKGRFNSYAGLCIVGKIRRAIQNQAHTIRPPANYGAKLMKWNHEHAGWPENWAGSPRTTRSRRRRDCPSVSPAGCGGRGWPPGPR